MQPAGAPPRDASCHACTTTTPAFCLSCPTECGGALWGICRTRACRCLPPQPSNASPCDAHVASGHVSTGLDLHAQQGCRASALLARLLCKPCSPATLPSQQLPHALRRRRLHLLVCCPRLLPSRRSFGSGGGNSSRLLSLSCLLGGRHQRPTLVPGRHRRLGGQAAPASKVGVLVQALAQHHARRADLPGPRGTGRKAGLVWRRAGGTSVWHSCQLPPTTPRPSIPARTVTCTRPAAPGSRPTSSYRGLTPWRCTSS